MGSHGGCIAGRRTWVGRWEAAGGDTLQGVGLGQEDWKLLEWCVSVEIGKGVGS